MGVRNCLVEGVSGTGKTSVCHELNRRGYHAVNGDRELAYQGDPETGEPTDTASQLCRLDQRPPDEFGSKPSERELVVRLHRTRADIPATGVLIDATRPLPVVVDEILRHAEL